jgi:hypothetical protein
MRKEKQESQWRPAMEATGIDGWWRHPAVNDQCLSPRPKRLSSQVGISGQSVINFHPASQGFDP